MDLYTRRRVVGQERLDELTGPVVFVANHNSHMDTPVILRALPGRWRRRTAVAAATDYFYDKLRKALAVSLAFGTVPLDRNSGAGVGPGQTGHLDRLIGDGGSLLFFPEGTRSRDGRLHRFKKGGFKLAMQARVPIIPVTIVGSRQVLPPDEIIFRPGPIVMYLDAPIPTAGLGDDDLEPLMQTVYDAMAKHFKMQN